MKAEFENLEEQLRQHLLYDVEQLSVPALSAASRKLVQRRQRAQLPLWENLCAFVNLLRGHFRVYQLGATVLILCCGFFLYNGHPNQQTSEALLFQDHTGLTIANNTICVNSSTMLTCIPTMVIRN